jgi:hypothetical protein
MRQAAQAALGKMRPIVRNLSFFNYQHEEMRISDFLVESVKYKAVYPNTDEVINPAQVRLLFVLLNCDTAVFVINDVLVFLFRIRCC